MSIAATFRFAVIRTERSLAAWEVTSVTRLRGLGGELAAIALVSHTDVERGLIERTAERIARPTGRAALSDPEPASVICIRLGPSEALEAVRSLELDLILAFEPTGTFLPIVGDPDKLARRGIWTHAFAVSGDHPSLPPGFEAASSGAVSATVSLVRLTPSGEGKPLEQEWLRVEAHSYRQTRAACTEAAAELSARHLRRHAMPQVAARPLRLPMTDRRGELAAVRLIVKMSARAFASIARRALFSQDWNVGVIKRPIADVLAGVDAREIEWLPERAGDGFLADPFGIPLNDGRCLLLAEEWVGARARGRIVAATIDGARYVSPPRPVLERDVHLSYPHVIPDEGGWLFAPESSRAAEVALYQLGSDSTPARRVGTLLDGFAAVDPTVVEYAGRWWLFATDATRNADGHLHVWWGASARGPWTAHAHNPVKCDVRSARPGGTPFCVDGVLYRPAQDCSEAYGGSLVVNRIDVLTPEAFGETTVARLEPDPTGPYPMGIHTLSAVGETMLVDGKRYRFALPWKVRRKLSRTSSRLRLPIG